MLRRYAAAMARGRQNTFWVPLPLVFAMRRGVPVLDEERLARIVRTFSSAGQYWIEGGHVAHRTGGEWRATTFDLAVGGARATSVAGNAVLASIGRQLMAAIHRHGWTKRWSRGLLCGGDSIPVATSAPTPSRTGHASPFSQA